MYNIRNQTKKTTDFDTLHKSILPTSKLKEKLLNLSPKSDPKIPFRYLVPILKANECHLFEDKNIEYEVKIGTRLIILLNILSKSCIWSV